MPTTTILELWAPWCEGSRRIAPCMAELSAEQSKRVRFEKLNTDEDSERAEALCIHVLPTFLALDGEREIARLEGEHNRDELRRLALSDSL